MTHCKKAAMSVGCAYIDIVSYYLWRSHFGIWFCACVFPRAGGKDAFVATERDTIYRVNALVATPAEPPRRLCWPSNTIYRVNALVARPAEPPRRLCWSSNTIYRVNALVARPAVVVNCSALVVNCGSVNCTARWWQSFCVTWVVACKIWWRLGVGAIQALVQDR